MANLVERAGWVQVRVGGNTQEDAELVSNLPNGTILAKDRNNTSGPTSTPPLEFTADLLYLMANISKLTNAHWYLGSSLSLHLSSSLVIIIHAGIPFFSTTPFALEIVEEGQQILGDYLVGFQAGNEPDLYVDHHHRPSVARSRESKKRKTDQICQGYSQYDYFGEIGMLVEQIASDTLIPQKNNLLIVPSVQALWTPESVWNTGIVSSYSSSLYGLAVERQVPLFSPSASGLLTALPGTPTTTAPLCIPALVMHRKTHRISSSTIYRTTTPQTWSRATSTRPSLQLRTGSRSSCSRPTPPRVPASQEFPIRSGRRFGRSTGRLRWHTTISRRRSSTSGDRIHTTIPSRPHPPISPFSVNGQLGRSTTRPSSWPRQWGHIMRHASQILGLSRSVVIRDFELRWGQRLITPCVRPQLAQANSRQQTPKSQQITLFGGWERAKSAQITLFEAPDHTFGPPNHTIAHAFWRGPPPTSPGACTTSPGPLVPPPCGPA